MGEGTPIVVWEPQPRQADAISCPAFEVFYGGAKGGGKALGIGTPIPTPEGWKRLEEIREGDEVLGMDGRPTRVIAATEVMYGRPCYRVEFDTGESVIADAGHRWLTLTLAERAAYTRRTNRPERGDGKKPWLADLNRQREHKYKTQPEGQIRTTEEIAETIVEHNARNHAVPTAGVLVLTETALPIPPYTLGAWLGDGTSLNGSITTPDQEVVEAIEADGYRATKWSSEYAWGIAGLKMQLRAAGLLGNKHIPREYLRASQAQRLALLQGLVDTDGTVGHNGAVEFTSTSRDIAEGFTELVRTFGIKATIREAPAKLQGRIVGVQYRIKFTTTMPVARLGRKAARIPGDTSPVTRRHFIVAAEPVPSVPVKCIQVQAKDGMFLCTGSLIPTHNSDFLIGDYLAHYEEWGEAWKGILFRRSYKELDEIVGRSKQIIGKIPGATYVGGDQMIWKIPAPNARYPGLATLRFRSLESDLDLGKYNGHQYPWIGFDELTEFPNQGPYVFMLSCCRSPDGAPCYVRATGNPGRPGHVWVKARFVDVADPYDIYVDPGSGMNRCFIPARLEDNIRMMEQDPEYERRLLLQPQHLIKALRWGDWDVIAGQVLGEYRRELHVIQNKPLGEGWYRFVSMDWGFARPFSIGWWAVNDDGRLIRTREWYGCTGEPNTGLRMGAKAVAAKAWAMSVETNAVTMVADPACWSKDDDLPSIAETFASYGFKMVKATNDRKNGLAKIHEMLQAEGHDRRPMLLISDICTDWMRTVPYLTSDPRDPEDINTELEDHCFIDGTMIETTEGLARIEDMLAGDYVITRVGPRRVLDVWHEGERQTVVASFSNGGKIEATPAHKVWVDGRGFVRIDEMRYGDIVMFREEPCRPNESNTTGSYSGDTRNQNGKRTGDTTNHPPEIDAVELNPSTVKPGNKNEGQYQTGGKSITWTGTQPTTISPTSGVSLRKNTSGSTMQERSTIHAEEGLKQPRGIQRTQGGIGIQNTQEKCGRSGKEPSACARNVENHTQPEPWGNPGTAASDAGPVHFVGVTQGTIRTVHDLSVEGTHEYFADGLLVSNCYDDTRYACMSEYVLNPRALRVREKLRAGTMKAEAPSAYDDLRRGL